tara:strand:- start:136 stop:789 length:654 start_codon:yes stop_codon:yes gene_type:complete
MNNNNNNDVNQRAPSAQSFLADLGESTFHNVQARTRKSRRDRESKETLEKSRLEQRRECHFKYENLGKLTEMKPGSLGFASNSDRFQTDTSGEEYLGRQTAIHGRKAMLDAKRAALIEREEARWQQIERAQEAERAKWNKIREEGARNRTNVNSVPYNPVTLRYNDNEEGDDLRKSDNLVRVRAAQRAKILHDRGNSGFNPITGGYAAEVVIPEFKQ